MGAEPVAVYGLRLRMQRPDQAPPSLRRANAWKSSNGSGMNVVVLCSLAISRMVCR